jgi:glutamine amidotransferase
MCPRFGEVAESTASVHAIAHVRKKTVGETSLANTHPFARERYVFAHNGTLPRVGALEPRTSPARLAEIGGDTDSERLFAFVLTHVDATGDVARGVSHAVRELHSIRDLGAANFVFSDGQRMFAHRQGRTLYSLACRQRGEDGRCAAIVAVASEPLTDEPWREIAEGALVELDLGAGRLRDVLEIERQDCAA